MFLHMFVNRGRSAFGERGICMLGGAGGAASEVGLGRGMGRDPQMYLNNRQHISYWNAFLLDIARNATKI